MRKLFCLASLVSVALLGACNDDHKATNFNLSASSDMTAKVDAAGGAACDAVKQDCPSGQKCTVTQIGTDPNTATFATACVPGGGTIASGMPCVRNNDMLGDDMCANGLFCTGVGYPVDGAGNPLRHCNPLCATDADCGTTQQCIALTDDGLTGLCVTSCAPLSDTCGNTMSCSEFIGDIDMMNLLATCRVSGTGAVGDGCNADTDCGGNQICDQTGTCTQLCDDAHACPTFDMSPACNAFDPSSSLGVCE